MLARSTRTASWRSWLRPSDSLPAWVHDTLDNVEILIDDEPPSGQRNLLGLYEGIPLTVRGDNYTGVLPDKITLFAGPMWREAGGDEDRLRARGSPHGRP